MEKIILNISGMHCASCAKIIEMELTEKSGIDSVSVNFDEKKAFIEYESSETDVVKIIDVINKVGYKAIE